ncbi:hypothetical protein GCM10011532_04800 [Christiangramia forsetii]|nr:hypothetical protein GCM10011532_04800 [Christiangramia forsetii]
MFFDFSSEKEADKINDREVEIYQKQLDSLNRIAPSGRDTIYPFNPNYITDFKGYQLGMKLEEIDRLLVYRQNGKWINSVEDFQKITGVSDSLLNRISRSFRFPEWTNKRNSVTFQNKGSKGSDIDIAISDLNSASAEDFKLINGVGDVLSERIVKYRKKIGGFVSSIQLNDVYGLSSEVIERIDKKFQIVSRPNIAIKNLNLITEAELAEIPYFNGQLVRGILSYRRLHEKITSFEELSKINDFPYDKIDRIKLYLTLE